MVVMRTVADTSVSFSLGHRFNTVHDSMVEDVPRGRPGIVGISEGVLGGWVNHHSNNWKLVKDNKRTD